MTTALILTLILSAGTIGFLLGDRRAMNQLYSEIDRRNAAMHDFIREIVRGGHDPFDAEAVEDRPATH